MSKTGQENSRLFKSRQDMVFRKKDFPGLIKTLFLVDLSVSLDPKIKGLGKKNQEKVKSLERVLKGLDQEPPPYIHMIVKECQEF